METPGVYRGDYDIDNEGDLSFHSSDGSDEDDSCDNLSLGDGVKGTSPPANACTIAAQSLLGRHTGDLPD